MADDTTPTDSTQTDQSDSDVATLALKALQDLVVAVNGMTQALTNAPT